MNRQRYTITESELRYLIREQVEEAINEGFFSNVGRALKNTFSGDAHRAATRARETGSNMWNATKNAAGAVGNATKKAAGAVGNAVQGAASAVGDAVGNAASQVRQGVNNRVQRTKESYQVAKQQEMAGELKKLLQQCIDNGVLTDRDMPAAKKLLGRLDAKDQYFNLRMGGIQDKQYN